MGLTGILVRLGRVMGRKSSFEVDPGALHKFM